MAAKVLVTNNSDSNHAPEMWATATAEMLIDSSNLSGDRAEQAKKLQTEVADVLQRYHAIVQDTERKALLNDAQRFHMPLEVAVDVDNVLEDVVEVTDKSDWKDHFRKHDVQDLMRQCLYNHFHTSAKLERQLYADKLQARKEI